MACDRGFFLMGAIITISEPDLQVLAEQVPSVPNRVLILVIACGVGMFLVAAVLRMLFGIPLSKNAGCVLSGSVCGGLLRAKGFSGGGI